MIRTVRTTLALALAVLVATALAQGGGHAAHHAPADPVVAPVAPAGMGMGMGMSMATQTVDEASFLVHMIPHHAEAVASAEALRAVTARPELIELLDAIVASQTAEIAQMEAWLDAWHPDVARDVAYAPMMRDLGPDASVADRERAFLEDMIGHHMMAVHEAQTLLAGGLAEHDEVAALARSIVAEQMGEMHQMAAWLAEWFGVAAPMGMGAGGMEMGMGMGMMGGGLHGAGRMGDARGAMHGTSGGAIVGAAEAERLALAFVAGRTDGAGTPQVVGTSVVHEVTVQVGDVTWVLRVDARTGAVTLATER